MRRLAQVHRTTFLLTVHFLLIASLVLSPVGGLIVEEEAGWVTCSPEVAGWRGLSRWHFRRAKGPRGRPGHGYPSSKSWQVALLRSLLLWGLWRLSGQVGPGWLVWVPWAIWLLSGATGLAGRLRDLLWQGQRLLVMVYLVMGLLQLGSQLVAGSSALGLGLGCVACGDDQPKVQVEWQADGGYQATLCGHFTLRVAGDLPFRQRWLLIFLGLLQTSADQRSSRRTRDGRTPFVRQEQLATWFGMPQERISDYLKYWLEGDWANLLSLKSPLVLTADLLDRIVEAFATFPHGSTEQVYQHLRQQGVPVTRAQVEQAARQSGWQRLQQSVQVRYELTPAGFRLRESWLIQQLLTQIEDLLQKLEAGRGLAVEERLSLHDLQTLAGTVGATAELPLKALPWLLCVERFLFGQWEAVTEGEVHCPSCGSTQVARKSKQPRWKKYYDAEDQLQQVAVYRYYCRNTECAQGSFTHLPAGLVPYSRYRTQVHLLAWQMYVWGESTYRRTGSALGVYSMTAWRWVSAFGHDLLPIAALFGMVRSSGVVGIDEKYVLVPKNDKPETEMRRWMYVYLAVDVWTYDLLHIAIYAYNNQASAQAFLLALRAKGYHPTVIVTDLRQDYGPLISQLFPQAQHHLCIFHALQDVQVHIKTVYGANYAQEHPTAQRLKEEIYAIFDTAFPDEAQRRFDAVFSLKAAYVGATPYSVTIFDFLERHWPKLVNAIGDDRIPLTNNAAEMVIRRFDHHYQNFCGFESLESAQRYLALFEKVYRLTPFSQDAQPRIRGQSPLQLAGYDVARLPITAICSGLSIEWPLELAHVPN
jgi:transposase-like protein